MAVDRVQRRIAAILAADVVGYSRLMGHQFATVNELLKVPLKVCGIAWSYSSWRRWRA
jgi:class 3 adenylate cyclase